MELNKNKDTNTNKNSTAPDQGGGYYPAPEKKTGAFKLAPWILVLALSVSFGIYQLQKVKSSPSVTVTTETTADPLANQLVEQSERQALIESMRGVAGAEDHIHGIQIGNVTMDDHNKQYANSPDEHLHAKEGEVQTKAQEYHGTHTNFEAILTKCYISGKDVHFVTKSGEIMKHVTEGEPLASAQMEQARSIAIANNTQSIWVLVYEDRLETVNAKGDVLQTVPVQK